MKPLGTHRTAAAAVAAGGKANRQYSVIETICFLAFSLMAISVKFNALPDKCCQRQKVGNHIRGGQQQEPSTMIPILFAREESGCGGVGPQPLAK